jgi:hypothetical protein
LSAECAVGSVVVVEILPFGESFVEDFGVVDELAVEESVELLASRNWIVVFWLLLS